MRKDSIAYPGESRFQTAVETPTVESKILFLRMLINRFSTDQRVREYAVCVLREFGVKPRDQVGQVRALLRHVQSFYYTPEKHEMFATPIYTLQKRMGDCDDFVSALGALLESIGIDTRIEVMGWDPNAPRATLAILQEGKRAPWGSPNSLWRHVYLRALGLALEPTLPIEAGVEPSMLRRAIT